MKGQPGLTDRIGLDVAITLGATGLVWLIVLWLPPGEAFTLFALAVLLLVILAVVGWAFAAETSAAVALHVGRGQAAWWAVPGAMVAAIVYYAPMAWALGKAGPIFLGFAVGGTALASISSLRAGLR